MNKKIFTLKININVIELIMWICSFWMFLSLMIAIVGQSSSTNWINYWSFGKNHNNSSGDKGALIILLAWLSAIIPFLIKGKVSKLFGGMFLFILSLVTFIGTLITSADLNTALCWTIPTVLLTLSGLWYILDGAGIIESIVKKRKTKKENKRNKKRSQKIK